LRRTTILVRISTVLMAGVIFCAMHSTNRTQAALGCPIGGATAIGTLAPGGIDACSPISTRYGAL